MVGFEDVLGGTQRLHLVCWLESLAASLKMYDIVDYVVLQQQRLVVLFCSSPASLYRWQGLMHQPWSGWY